MDPGDSLRLRVGPPAAGGACVARADDGRVVFVRHALPGEDVTATVTSVTASFARADAVDIHEASDDRVEPPCPYAGPGRCGGCDWQHAAPAAQPGLKAAVVADQLRRIGGLDVSPPVEAPGDGPLGWRTRVRFAVDDGGRPGFHRHRDRRVVPVQSCLIASAGVEAAGVEASAWPGADHIEVAATADGAHRVVSVSSRRGRKVRAAPVDAGLLVDGRQKRAPSRLSHEVMGRRFSVSAGGFWQVHRRAPSVLAAAVLEGLEPRPGERGVDLYAGAGLFACLLAERTGGPVTAVESHPRSAADLARNAGSLAVEVVADEVTPELAATPADLVVADPPRAGLGQAVVSGVARSGARRLAYVSCDAASLARDLGLFRSLGWSLHSLRVFDLFPMTEHVELVAVLTPASDGSSPR